MQQWHGDPVAAPTTVTYTIVSASGAPMPNVKITARLRPFSAADLADDDSVVTAEVTTSTDQDGLFALPLLPNSAYRATGTWYRVDVAGGPSYAIVVPDTGPVSLWDCAVDVAMLVSAPPVIPDLHLLRAELGQAAGVASLDSSGTVPLSQIPASVGGGGGAGVITDHGDLTGLGDDDHPQYLTTARGDARYYTQTQTTVLLSAKADTVDPRLSDPRTPIGAAGGSLAGNYPAPSIAAGAVGAAEIAAAVKDPAAGVPGLRTLGAGAQQAAAGDDPRLSDARTPTVHAASHATAGGDPLTPAAIGAQAVDADLTAIAALAPGDGALLQRVAGAWAARTPAQVKVDLVLVRGDVGLSAVDNTADAAKPVSAAQQAAIDAAARVVASTQAGTAYTLGLGDAGTAVEFTAAAAVVVTVPPNSATAYPVGTVIELLQYGTGQVSVAAGAGVTVRTASSLTTRAQYSTLSLRKRATDEWVLTGDLT